MASPESPDRIGRGSIAGGAARGVAVIATGLVREAVRRHAATGAAAIAMGRAAVAGLLLATLTKDDERVTLQILGDGPLGAVTVDASGAGTARVFVGHPAVAGRLATTGRPTIADAVGRLGLVNVIRQIGLGVGPARDFSGQTPVIDGEIDTDVEHYLCHSEQIDSALGCETLLDDAGHVQVAVGVLVQALPHGDGAAVVAAARQRLRTGALGRLLTAPSNPGVGPTDLIAAVLGVATAGREGVVAGRVGPDVRVSESHSDTLLGERPDAMPWLDERPVRFHCPCSRERAASTLALLGEEDLLTMIREEGRADVTCEFCRERYDFTDTALEQLRHDIRRQAPRLA